MEFEWDTEKERENILNHKVDFTTASRIWDGTFLEHADQRRDYGEERIEVLGEVNDRLMVVIFTWRGSARRIISARKANPREQRRFKAQIGERS